MAHGANGTTRDWRQTALVVLLAFGFIVSFGGAGIAFVSDNVETTLPLLAV